MNIKAGDRVIIRPEWRDRGDYRWEWRSIEDEIGDGHIRISPVNIGLAITPNQTVNTSMLVDSDTVKRAIVLGEAFCNVLSKWLTPEQIVEAAARNAQESDEIICHSHDFCDANMAMWEAWQQAFGSEPLMVGTDGTPEEQAEEEQQRSLWNMAWELAKVAKFNGGGVR